MNVNDSEILVFIENLICENKTFTFLQEAIVKGTWERKGYQKIADETSYEHDTVKKTGNKLWKQASKALKTPVNKATFRRIVERKYQESRDSIAFQPEQKDIQKQTKIDWGNAFEDISIYGRDEELATLEKAVVEEKCRLMMLLGMGGIGKTDLAICLAKQIQPHFEYIIWRSVSESSLKKILDDCLKFISNQTIVEFPDSISDKIRELTKLLQASRCLLVLDNFESVIVNNNGRDSYLEENARYGDLIQRISKTNHQSCLLLTSRVKPPRLARIKDKKQPVRTLEIEGLAFESAKQIFRESDLQGSIEEEEKIVQIYSGHPLALKIISDYIENNFNGNMTEFLSQNTPIYGEIQQILDEQFDLLSDIEKSIMYWLAINRESVSRQELLQDIIPQPMPNVFQAAITHITERSLIQSNDRGCSLQNVIMEYITQDFVGKIIQEIESGQLKLFHTHALIKATTSEYIREAQIRLILKPIADILSQNFSDLETKLIEIVQTVKEQPQLSSGYAIGNILNLLCYLKDKLCGYDLSHLTIRQAYLQGMTLHNVNLSHCQLIQSIFTQDFGIVFSVASSPDGKYLATGHSSGTISIWEVATGKELSNCVGHTGRVYGVAFSPDGTMLASSSDDRTVRLWNVPDGTSNKTMQGHTNSVGTVSFSPNGKILASGSEDNTIRLWDVPDGNCRHILKEHSDHVWSVAFSPDGTQLASGSFDSSIKLWNVNSGSCIETLIGHNDAIASVAYSPDGTMLASGSHDRTVMLWNVDSGSCTEVLRGHSDRIWSVAFDSEGKTIASGSYDKTVRLWNLKNNTCVNTLTGHTNWVRSIAFVGSGETLVSGSYDSTIRMWNTSKGDCSHIFHGYYVSICATAIDPDGKMLASGSADSLIRLWNAPERSYWKNLSGHSGWVYAVAFSPNSEVLASGSSDKTVKIWSIKEGVCLNSFLGHNGWVYAVAFSPDRETLASGSSDRSIRLWNINNGGCLYICQEHEGTVGTVKFSPDGKILASGSQDKTIRLWNVRSGNCIEILRGHTDQIWSLAFNPEGNTLASSSFDKTVRLWDVKSGKCIKVLQGHSSFLLSVAFSPDGKMLASGGYGKVIKLWDVSSGECISTLKGHTNWIRSIVFNPDGQTIISGSQDETIKIWELETGDCVETLEAPKPYENTDITGISGLTEPEKLTLKLLGAVDS